MGLLESLEELKSSISTVLDFYRSGVPREEGQAAGPTRKTRLGGWRPGRLEAGGQEPGGLAGGLDD